MSKHAARRAAIREYKDAERQLADVPEGSGETPAYLTANNRVACAEMDPALPKRYLDPEDR